MREVELKFRVGAEQREAVSRAVAGRTPAPRRHLVAVYVDTPGRALAQAALALRVRREGRRWVQALKGAGDDGLTRFEHEVAIAAPAAPVPPADPARHAGTPAGDQLAALLEAHPGATLDAIYRTDIHRRMRSVRRGAATVELCFDAGSIVAGERSLPVCELEIELRAGTSVAVIDEARRWVTRFGVTLDARTKAERGDLLARGLTQATARTARGAVLDAAMSPAQALRGLIRLCADQVIRNASQIASGEHGPDHVHQLRVGLRRLRSALKLFEPHEGEPALVEPALAEGAAQLFRRLGAIRDADVLGASTGNALAAALQAAGFGAAPIALATTGDVEPAARVVRDVAAQHFMLDLIAAGIEPPDVPAAAGATLRKTLAARIARWHRSAGRDAARYSKLDDEARHALRKRIKRLRYATEFSAALFGAKAVRRYLVPLKALQERLGELNDVVVALDAVQAARGETGREGDVRLAYAQGWLAARRDALITAAAPALGAFADAKAFWKNA